MTAKRDLIGIATAIMYPTQSSILSMSEEVARSYADGIFSKQFAKRNPNIVTELAKAMLPYQLELEAFRNVKNGDGDHSEPFIVQDAPIDAPTNLDAPFETFHYTQASPVADELGDDDIHITPDELDDLFNSI